METQQWPQEWKGSVFISILKKGNAKESSNYCTIALISHTSRRRQWQPTPVLLPGKSHGRRSLVGCSPWGCEELDMTERLLSWIGERNGNPLQCSCLENPRDGRAWWAVVYGVAQSLTGLKRFSSSSSNRYTRTRAELRGLNGIMHVTMLSYSRCSVTLTVAMKY